MRTAIVSDLHLGTASGEDLLRDPAIRRAAARARSPAPTASSCSATRSSCATWPLRRRARRGPPLLRGARRGDGRARGGDRPRQPRPPPGRAAARPALARRRRPGSGSSSTTSAPGDGAGADDRRLARRGEPARSPTRASGCATTSTRPTAITWTATCACRGSSAWPAATLMRALRAAARPGDAGRLRAGAAADLRLRYGVAQARARVGRPRPGPSESAWKALAGATTAAAVRRARAAAPPRRGGIPAGIWALNRLLRAEFSADISAADDHPRPASTRRPRWRAGSGSTAPT